MTANISGDYNPWGAAAGAPPPENGKQGLFEKKKLSARVSEKYEKTKLVACSSMKKVKEGASSGATWVKIKCRDMKKK